MQLWAHSFIHFPFPTSSPEVFFFSSKKGYCWAQPVGDIREVWGIAEWAASSYLLAWGDCISSGARPAVRWPFHVALCSGKCSFSLPVKCGLLVLPQTPVDSYKPLWLFISGSLTACSAVVPLGWVISVLLKPWLIQWGKKGAILDFKVWEHCYQKIPFIFHYFSSDVRQWQA